MTRNEAIELLEKYNQHLLKEGYVDADFYAEHDVTAIDSFLATKWAKENLPLQKKESIKEYIMRRYTERGDVYADPLVDEDIFKFAQDYINELKNE
jgi:hypothetical protein